MWVYRKQVILALKEDATPLQPPHEADVRVCERSWGGLSVSSFTHSGQNHPLSVYVCVCVMKVRVWLNRKWGRRTCLSPWTSSRLSVSSRLRCTGCVTHTFHIPVDVSGSPARQLIVTHALWKDGSPLRVGLTPTADPFPSGPYLHTVSMCTFTSAS